MTDEPSDPRLAQLERRVRTDPSSVAFAALAEEYRRAGRIAEAIEVCRAGLTRHPAYLSARVTLGRALIEAGAIAEARRELDKVIAVAPENLAAIRALAEIHHRHGDAHLSEEPGASTIEAASTESSREFEPADASPPAASPRVASSDAGRTPPPAPVEDPVLVDLKQFLEAIVAARSAREQARR